LARGAPGGRPRRRRRNDPARRASRGKGAGLCWPWGPAISVAATAGSCSARLPL